MITPEILNGKYGFPELTNSTIITASTSNALGVGSWITSSAAAVLASAADSVAYIVDGILLPDGVTPKQNQYLTAAEALSGGYKLRVVPIGGLYLAMEEDGDGGNISDANITAAPYADVVVTAPADSGEAEKTADGVAAAHASVKIDSSSVNASSSSLCVQILGLHTAQNALINKASLTNPAWSAGTQRIFRVKVIDASASVAQE